MGIFSNLFGNKDQYNDLKPSAEMMEEDQFWAIVERSIPRNDDQDEQESKLVSALSKLTPGEMIGFRLRTDQLLHETYTSDMWCAAYLIQGGCSDDMFEYFRLWVISRGRKAYYDAKANPDSLVDILPEENEPDFESFWYVALTAFQQKTGLELYDYIDYNNVRYGEGKYPQFDFTWKEDNPESQKAICPKLYERFMQ